MTPLALIAGIATGLVLGIFGSGGSIIAMPALLYLLDVEAKQAIAMSLGIIAVTATISAFDHWRHHNVNLRIAAVFGLFGMIGTYAGARLGVLTPVIVQLVLFALIMYAAAGKMLAKKTAADVTIVPAPPPDEPIFGRRMAHIAGHGIVVGALTGLVGVGGGFLIVPSLVLLSGIPIRQAIGTSLAIVAAKSYAGFAGYLGAVPVDYALMGSFTAVTVASSLVGARLARRLPGESLKRGFAWFLVAVASYILLKSVFGA
ncbi:MAG: sulfite exporter TauE/SafE family protein [Betaproteobacteria bacterium]|nr:sulfite exporter TauE/SafE family protein [Betaproteobacteria bacterium]